MSAPTTNPTQNSRNPAPRPASSITGHPPATRTSTQYPGNTANTLKSAKACQNFTSAPEVIADASSLYLLDKKP